jgi:hypothetical protein
MESVELKIPIGVSVHNEITITYNSSFSNLKRGESLKSYKAI